MEKPMEPTPEAKKAAQEFLLSPGYDRLTPQQQDDGLREVLSGRPPAPSKPQTQMEAVLEVLNDPAPFSPAEVDKHLHQAILGDPPAPSKVAPKKPGEA